eukprot:TRINITY_DN11384_c0_g1_i3.p1 TRINITY_DN11384_c0_g1~~TRINITY_DN11384_c0_g1_i3.p1  ORF type:complete len:402 (+),score=55.86 TRINITY_DN11384_c0_g1_i3:86-1291(+)
MEKDPLSPPAKRRKTLSEADDEFPEERSIVERISEHNNEIIRNVFELGRSYFDSLTKSDAQINLMEEMLTVISQLQEVDLKLLAQELEVTSFLAEGTDRESTELICCQKLCLLFQNFDRPTMKSAKPASLSVTLPAKSREKGDDEQRSTQAETRQESGDSVATAAQDQSLVQKTPSLPLREELNQAPTPEVQTTQEKLTASQTQCVSFEKTETPTGFEWFRLDEKGKKVLGNHSSKQIQHQMNIIPLTKKLPELQVVSLQKANGGESNAIADPPSKVSETSAVSEINELSDSSSPKETTSHGSLLSKKKATSTSPTLTKLGSAVKRKQPDAEFGDMEDGDEKMTEHFRSLDLSLEEAEDFMRKWYLLEQSVTRLEELRELRRQELSVNQRQTRHGIFPNKR